MAYAVEVTKPACARGQSIVPTRAYDGSLGNAFKTESLAWPIIEAGVPEVQAAD